MVPHPASGVTPTLVTHGDYLLATIKAFIAPILHMEVPKGRIIRAGARAINILHIQRPNLIN